MAQVVGHLTIDELQARYRDSEDATLARHYQVIWLLAQGRGYAEVAELTSYARRWVEQILARYNAFGPDSLGDLRRRNGAAATVADARGAGHAARAREEAAGRRRGWWTARKVAAVMALELGREVAEQRGWEALRAIGWTIQRPRPRHSQAATPEEQADFKKKLAETVAEEAQRHPGAVIEVFATDEHRIGLKPILRRVWAPRGERPIALGHHRFQWLYVTAFVSPATGESLWYLSTRVSKPLFEETLALFAREVGAGPRTHRPARARWRRLAHRSDQRARRHPPGLPATIHARAAAGRDALDPCRRANRQPAFQDTRRPRRRRR